MLIQIPQDEIKTAYSKIKALSQYLPPGSCRYLTPEPIGYVSPGAQHSYMLVFLRTDAYLKGKKGLIPQDVANEIVKKVKRENVPFDRAEWWEGEIKHDVRAVVRTAQEILSDKAKNYAYLDHTSYDLVNTAQSLGIRDMSLEVTIPKTINLGRVLLERADEEADTIMIGRTHRQHAQLTTAGHYLCEVAAGVLGPLPDYINATKNLPGKHSGFIGTNAEYGLLFNSDSEKFREEFFKLLDLKEDEMTGQTVHQHHYTRYFSELGQICGGIAKFANDMRSFQQTEVGEIFEKRLDEQVGSSTGAHKVNPVGSENVSGGQWRQYTVGVYSTYYDLLTDWERDLMDSSNKRYYIYNLMNISNYMLNRGTRIAKNMTIRKEKMIENVGITQGLICAQPLQMFLQKYIGDTGKPFIDAHDYVKKLTDRARDEGRNFVELIQEDELVNEALNSDSVAAEKILDPEKFIAHVAVDVHDYVRKSQKQLDEIELICEKHNQLTYI